MVEPQSLELLMSNLDLYHEVLEEAKWYKEGLPAVAYRCLKDSKRTLTLMGIISKHTQKGQIGVDLGAVTGILGLTFLNAGGKFVHLVDSSGDSVDFIEDLARRLGFSSRIGVYEGDATMFRPKSEIDFVIAELIDTGLAEEPFVQAVIDIRNLTHRDTVYVPQKAVSTIAIYHNNQRLSEEKIYDSFDATSDQRTCVNRRVQVRIIQNGIPTRATLRTELYYRNGQSTSEFNSLCVPRFVHLYPKGEVEKDDKITISIRYGYGERNISVYGRQQKRILFNSI